MHYVALATDYDGTIAHDGVVDEATTAALERLKAGSRRLILVTGRELPDLEKTLPRLDLFDLIVAENGALLYRPDTKEERALVEPPDPRFVARLRELDVHPLSVGRAIVATWEPNETKVLEAIRDLGLELKITFNKGAVMVLPAAVTKASGLKAALAALDLSPLNCVAVGDAENDMTFLDYAGLSVAVANAIPPLRERVAWVTAGARGEGVAQLIDRMLETDLAAFDPGLPRHRVALAERGEGEEPLWFTPARDTLLLAGSSGAGKSTLTTGLTERLAAGGFQFCLIDPEGDYEGLDHVLPVGAPDHPPTASQVTDMLRKTETSVAVNLLGVKLEDRPPFLSALMSDLQALRARLGRPHFVIVDEAHHMISSEGDPGGAAARDDLTGFLFITTQPGAVSPGLLRQAGRLLVLGDEPGIALEAFCRARDLCFEPPEETLARGELLVLDAVNGAIERGKVIPCAGMRQRHRRKYAEGKLGHDKSFWFRGPEGKLNLRAHNLMLFVQLGDGVDDATWEWHRKRGDYSRWIEDSIKDRELAGEIAEIEAGPEPADNARQLLRKAIEARYTLPG